VNSSPLPVSNSYVVIVSVFIVWMLFDAVRRRAGWFWYPVILLAPLIYFLFVKLPAMISARGASDSGTDSEALDASRLSSSFPIPNLERADQLEESEHYDQAMPIYQDALARDASDLRALHGMARCELGLGHPRVAVTLLEQVLAADREYRNYCAALDYADALWLAGQRRDTLELLEGLVEVTRRVNHRLAFAHYLATNGDVDKAQSEVRRVIDEHAALPVDEQLRDKYWIERANGMLADWEPGSERLTPT
jgi:hypothetical protein